MYLYIYILLQRGRGRLQERERERENGYMPLILLYFVLLLHFCIICDKEIEKILFATWYFYFMVKLRIFGARVKKQVFAKINFQIFD